MIKTCILHFKAWALVSDKEITLRRCVSWHWCIWSSRLLFCLHCQWSVCAHPLCVTNLGLIIFSVSSPAALCFVFLFSISPYSVVVFWTCLYWNASCSFKIFFLIYQVHIGFWFCPSACLYPPSPYGDFTIVRSSPSSRTVMKYKIEFGRQWMAGRGE